MPPGFRAKQALGQHFIKDEALLNELVRLAGIGPKDKVFEIGPGLGGLTAALAGVAQRVLALEVDEELLPILRVTLHGLSNVEVVQGDVMAVDLEALLAPLGSFHVVANLPYYLTTPILNRLLTLPLPLRSLSVMVQKEAAERIIAAPSTPGYGPLALLAQYRGVPRVARDIPASAFSPPPRTDSAFIVMPLHEKPPVQVADERQFFGLIGAAFQMRRKTLVNNLMGAFALSREKAQEALGVAGLPPQIRGEALSLRDFAALYRVLCAGS